MTKPKYVLNFTVGEKGEVFIHADRDGLTKLINSLDNIRKKIDAGICEHDHLMSDAWGGSELSERKGIQAGELIHHVKIFGWTDEWIKKHGFR